MNAGYHLVQVETIRKRERKEMRKGGRMGDKGQRRSRKEPRREDWKKTRMKEERRNGRKGIFPESVKMRLAALLSSLTSA